MSSNRNFSDSMNNGPGRNLCGVLAFSPKIDLSIEDMLNMKASDMVSHALKKSNHIYEEVAKRGLEDIHEQAIETLEEEISIVGALEQFFLYHHLIKKNVSHLRNLFQEALPVFVSTLSTDIIYNYEEIEDYPELQLKEKLESGKKWGVDITSNHSHLGRKLLSNHIDGNIRILEEIEKGNYPHPQPDRRIIYIPIAPVVTFVEYQEPTFVNIFEENLVKIVNRIMDKKDKKLMGSTRLTRDFETPFYEYRPSFYDPEKALKVMREKGPVLQKDKEILQRHTRYNRIVTSFIYSSILETIPNNLWSGSDNEIYVFTTQKSPLYKIMEYATQRAGKRIHPARIMRNTKFPTFAEAEDSALNILKGFQMDVLLGPASKQINISSYFS